MIYFVIRYPRFVLDPIDFDIPKVEVRNKCSVCTHKRQAADAFLASA